MLWWRIMILRGNTTSFLPGVYFHIQCSSEVNCQSLFVSSGLCLMAIFSIPNNYILQNVFCSFHAELSYFCCVKFLVLSVPHLLSDFTPFSSLIRIVFFLNSDRRILFIFFLSKTSFLLYHPVCELSSLMPGVEKTTFLQMKRLLKNMLYYQQWLEVLPILF